MIATVDAPAGIKSGTGVLSGVFHGQRGHWFASQHGF
jgi:hypothetical protein